MQAFKVASDCTVDMIAVKQLDVGRAGPPVLFLLLLFVLLSFHTDLMAAPKKFRLKHHPVFVRQRADITKALSML